MNATPRTDIVSDHVMLLVVPLMMCSGEVTSGDGMYRGLLGVSSVFSIIGRLWGKGLMQTCRIVHCCDGPRQNSELRSQAAMCHFMLFQSS